MGGNTGNEVAESHARKRSKEKDVCVGSFSEGERVYSILTE